MKFKTAPFKHQEREWLQSRSLPTRAIHWEQGTGKTKLAIDTAAHLYEEGSIDGVLLIAPPGVSDNWVLDELPTHLSTEGYDALAFQSKRAATKWHQKAVADNLAHEGMAWLCFTYPGYMTKKGRKAAENFLAKRKVLFICDESQRIKTPGAKRTRAIAIAGKKAAYRRTLTGTPVTNSPFDIYSQYRFLEWDFWKRHGFASYAAFKTYFGVFEERVNGATGQRFQQIVCYRNLDQLAEIVSEIATRVTKDDVEEIDFPAKVYTRRYHELTGQQARLYTELRDECITYLDDGEAITAPLVIVKLLRLQQILCGYLPSDDCETLNRLDENPRLDLLQEVIKDVEGKVLIFARFTEDINQIMGILGDEAVQYNGEVSRDDRIKAKLAFQKGDARFFVGNPAAAGTGLTLHAAKTVIFYSNSFKLEDRLQAEDRAHRIGQDGQIIDHDEDGNPIMGVRYIDLLARGTVDTRIVSSLRTKFNIASKITGDDLRSWL